MRIEHIEPLTDAQRIQLRDVYIGRMRALADRFNEQSATPEVIQAMEDMANFVDRMESQLAASSKGERETSTDIGNPDSHEDLSPELKDSISSHFAELSKDETAARMTKPEFRPADTNRDPNS